jgi:hypothetical protein
VLDDHEGWAVDVAEAPDGRLWVAMNVRLAPNVWRPRIVLLDPTGQFTGVEVPAEAGQTVTGLDNDGTGGCVAVGFAGTGQGDTDVVVWRMNGDHVPVLSGKSWDYQAADDLPHEFTDIATDVVVQDGVAWIVGLSYGHDDEKDLRSRGIHPAHGHRHGRRSRARHHRADIGRLDAEQAVRGRPAPGRHPRHRQRLQRHLRQPARRDRPLHGRGRASLVPAGAAVPDRLRQRRRPQRARRRRRRGDDARGDALRGYMLGGTSTTPRPSRSACRFPPARRTRRRAPWRSTPSIASSAAATARSAV